MPPHRGQAGFIGMPLQPGGFMGTQQSRSGHGRQGSEQHSQQTDHRPQQDRDLQRNKQSDRGQHHQGGASTRQQSQGGSSHRQQSQGGGSSDESQGVGLDRQDNEVQQSTLGGGRDFEHKLENEGREQNRMQDTQRRQMSQQNVGAGQQAQRASGQVDALRGSNEYGEGNYAGTRQYDKATKEYAESGRVEEAARAAAPKSEAEAREMQAAEDEGKRHAKGEDPALTRHSPPASGTPRSGRGED
jgi:hypothetical protein